MENNIMTNSTPLVTKQMYTQYKLNGNLLNKSKEKFYSKLNNSCPRKLFQKSPLLFIDMYKSRNINNFNKINFFKNSSLNNIFLYKNYNKNIKSVKPSKSILLNSSTKQFSSLNNSNIYENLSNNNYNHNFNQDLNLSFILKSKKGYSLNKKDIDLKLNKNYHSMRSSFNKNKNKKRKENTKLNFKFLLNGDINFYKNNIIKKYELNTSTIMNNGEYKKEINNKNNKELKNKPIKKKIEKEKIFISEYKNSKKEMKNNTIYNYNDLEDLYFSKISNQLSLKNQNNKLINYKEFIYELKNNTDYLERMRNYNNKIRLKKQNKNSEENKKSSFNKYNDNKKSIEKKNNSKYQKEEIKKQQSIKLKILAHSKESKNNTKSKKEISTKINSSNKKNNNSNKIKNYSNNIKNNNLNNIKNSSNIKKIYIKNNNSTEILHGKKNHLSITDGTKLINSKNKKYSYGEDKNHKNNMKFRKNSIISKKSYKSNINSLDLEDKIDEEIYVESAENNQRQLLSSATVDDYNNRSNCSVKRKSISKIINNMRLKKNNQIGNKKENNDYKTFSKLRKEKPDIKSIMSKKKLIEKIKEAESKNDFRRKSIKNYYKSPFLYLGKGIPESHKKDNNAILAKFIKKYQESHKFELKVRKKSRLTQIIKSESEDISSIINNNSIVTNDIIQNIDISENKDYSEEFKINLDDEDNFMMQYFDRYYADKKGKDTEIKNEKKIKEVYTMFLNLIQNNTKMMENASDKDQELFVEFREKMDSLKKVNNKIFEEFIFENYKYFKKELDDCKKGKYQEKCINNFLNNLNNDLDNRKRIESEQNIKAIFY